MMRMKERRREYAEMQLAFSKVSLINEVNQGKYNVYIENYQNHQQVRFLFCPEKVTDLLEKNKYWAEQVESLGGNIKGELMISLKRKNFNETIPIRPLHGQHGLNYWSFAREYENGGFLMVPRLVGKEIECDELFGEQCGFLLVDFFYHDWTRGVYNTLYQNYVPFAESRRVVLNAKMRELPGIIAEAGYSYGYHRHSVVRNWFTYTKEFSCDC